MPSPLIRKLERRDLLSAEERTLHSLPAGALWRWQQQGVMSLNRDGRARMAEFDVPHLSMHPEPR